MKAALRLLRALAAKLPGARHFRLALDDDRLVVEFVTDRVPRLFLDPGDLETPVDKLVASILAIESEHRNDALPPPVVGHQEGTERCLAAWARAIAEGRETPPTEVPPKLLAGLRQIFPSLAAPAAVPEDEAPAAVGGEDGQVVGPVAPEPMVEPDGGMPPELPMAASALPDPIASPAPGPLAPPSVLASPLRQGLGATLGEALNTAVAHAIAADEQGPAGGREGARAELTAWCDARDVARERREEAIRQLEERMGLVVAAPVDRPPSAPTSGGAAVPVVCVSHAAFELVPSSPRPGATPIKGTPAPEPARRSIRRAPPARPTPAAARVQTPPRPVAAAAGAVASITLSENQWAELGRLMRAPQPTEGDLKQQVQGILCEKELAAIDAGRCKITRLGEQRHKLGRIPSTRALLAAAVRSDTDEVC